MPADNGRMWYGVGLDDRQFQTTARRVNSQFSKIGNVAEKEGNRIDSAFRKIGAGMAVYFGGSQLFSYAKQIANVRGEFQQLEVSFKTMLKSKSKADALMADIVSMAANTPFQLKEVAAGAKSLLAYGESADNATATLTKLGDIASGLSIPLNDLVYLYGTTMTQGRLYTQDLNQFTGRGIPMIKELAKQFGVAESEVKGLVEAGKVGFPEVQKAINSLTQEGGMFAGLMSSQMETIPGLISNLGDAFDRMFNDIGKNNEGVITGAIKGAKFLVENYEDVWNILKVIIATYGTYKAAVISFAAVQKASMAASSVKAWFDLARGIKTAKDAQIAFNLVSKANPLLLLASVIAGVVTALVVFKKETNAAAEAAAKMSENIDRETDQLDATFEALKKTKEGTIERRKAIEQINTKYGDYLDNMLTEKTTAEELAAAYRDVKDAIVEASLEKAKGEFLKSPQEDLEDANEKFYKKIANMAKEIAGADQRGRFQSYIDQIAQEVKKTGQFSMWDVEDAFRAAQAKNKYQTIDDWRKAFRAGDEERMSFNEIYRRVGGWDLRGIETAGSAFARQASDLMNAKSEFDKYAKGYLSTLEEEEKTGGTGETETPELQNINEEIENTRANINRLKTDLRKLRTGETESADYAGDIEEKSKSLKEAEKRLELLIGEREEKVNNDLEKLKQSISEQSEQMQFDIEQARIDAMKDGIEKTLAQNELNYKKELYQLKKHREERKKELEKAGMSEENTSYYSDMEKAAFEALQRANAEAVRQEQEKNEKLLSEYETLLQKRERLKNEYEEKRTELKEAGATSEHLWELDRQRDEALADIDSQIAQREASFIVWTEQLANMGLKQLRDALEAAEATLSNTESKLTDKERAILRAKIEELEKRLEIAEARDKTKSSSDGSNAKWKDTLEVMNEVQEATQNIISSFDGMDDATKTALSAAMNISAGVIGMIKGIQTLSTAAAESIKAVERASVILAIVGAAVQVMTAIFKVFDHSKAEEEHQKAMQELMERRIKQQHEYNMLLLEQKLLMEESASIFGEDVISKAKNSVETYREAMELYRETIKGTRTDAEEWIREKYGGWRYNWIKDHPAIKAMREAKQAQYDAGIGALSDIEVVTGSKTVRSGFLGLGKKQKDVYSGILSVYPDLIDAENRLNLERAKAIVSTEKMRDADKELLQSMIDLEEQAREAEEALNDYLQETFGALGDGIMDSITEAISAGTDAWEDFGQAGAEVLEKLGKQIAYTLFFSESFKQLENDLKKVYQQTGKSDKEIAEESGALVEQFYNGIGSQMEAAQGFLERWDKQFESLDLWDGARREGASKGFGAMTQDSADELNGRFTAIQAHTYAINEGVRALVVNSDASLSYLSGIEQNTRRLARIETSLDEMNTKGLKLKA